MLSIIIVNYKNPPLLRLCLKSLARNLSNTVSYEIIVVDSASTIESRMVVTDEFTAAFPRITLVPFSENIGYTRGVNEGIRVAGGEYYLILNPDIIVLPGSVEMLLVYAQEHPEAGLIGPQLLNFDDSIQASCFRFYTPLTILYRRIGHLPLASHVLSPFLMRDVDLRQPTRVDWLMGSALMTSRSVCEHVGLMDQQFFLYMSEVDWARRFWDNGYAVLYYPSAQLYHYHKRESKGRFGIFDVLFKRETRWHIADAIRYFIKHGIRVPHHHRAQPALFGRIS